MSVVRAAVIIHGQVQGVFYRQSTLEMARKEGLSGWVKNCPDGTVAAVFEGEADLVQTALEWCRQGPPAARVSHVDVTWQPPLEDDNTFRILR